MRLSFSPIEKKYNKSFIALNSFVSTSLENCVQILQSQRNFNLNISNVAKTQHILDIGLQFFSFEYLYLND